MDESPDVDVDQIVARIRESIRVDHGDPGTSGVPAGLPGLGGEHEIATDIRTLHTSHDVSGGRRPSPRRVLGPFVDLGRRFVDRVLAPILAQQAAYNAAACRVVSQAVGRLDALASDTSRTARALHAHEQRALGLRRTVAMHEDGLVAIRSQLAALQQGAAALMRESTAQREQVQAQHAARGERVSALEQELAGLRRELNAQHERMAALNAQLAVHHEQVAALRRTVADQQDELADRNARLQIQQEQLAGALEQTDDHRRRIEDVRPRLADLERAVAEHGHGLAALIARLQSQEEEIATLGHGVASQEQQTRAGYSLVRDELTQFDAAQRALAAGLRERVARAERRLRSWSNGGPDGGRPHRGDGDGKLKATAERGRLDGLDYAGFEERFRGSEDEIKERQRVYVELFRGREDVVDIGCGRGEFLELLREAGIPGRGVDVDLDMILLCREKGLEVTQADGFAYLESVPDGSLGGVFAAQVVEHLEPRDVLELVGLIHRKLRPGGITVLETINPSCLATFATFYLDLTHVRPIPPGTLEFLLESADFTDVRIAYASPVDDALRIPRLEPGLFPDAARFNASIDRLNDLLSGYRDFSAIGVKRPIARVCPSLAP